MNKILFIFILIGCSSHAAVIYSQTSLDPGVSCATMYATQQAQNRINIFISPPEYLAAGEIIMLQSSMVTLSNTAHTAILNDMQIYVTFNGVPVDTAMGYSTIPIAGANNIGYAAQFQPELTLRETRLFTAPQSGEYVFSVGASAATSASTMNGYPTCNNHAGYAYQTMILPGSYLTVTQVQTGTERIQVHTWATGYAGLTAAYPSVNLLETEYTATGTTVNVSAAFELTSRSYATTTANAALVVYDRSTGTTACFPGNLSAQYVSGEPTCLAVTSQSEVIVNNAMFYQHHIMGYLDGSIQSNPGDDIVAWVEISYADGGNGILVDTGCDQSIFSSCPVGMQQPVSNMVIWEN